MHAQRIPSLAATLLTLRSKELGLPSESWLERARALAGTDTALLSFLDMVDVIPPDRFSENRDALFDIRRRVRAKQSLEVWRQRGGGPAFVRVSARCVRYRVADLEAWAAARLRHSTAEPGDVAAAPSGDGARR